MTSKTELKRLCVQDPIGMAERMHRLEKERDELREALRIAHDTLSRAIKDEMGEERNAMQFSIDVAASELEKDPA